MPTSASSGSKHPNAVAWLVGLCCLTFAVPALFVGVLHWERNRFLVPYVLAGGAFVALFLHCRGLATLEFLKNRWGNGLMAAFVSGAFVVSNVLRQPSSPPPGGLALVCALLWLGLAYGLLDALLLTVAPVLIIRQASERHALPAAALLAFAVSMAVTGAYHLGFPEFRGAQLAAPLIGNAALTVAYLQSRSVLAPTLGHMAMHVAAALHGLETTSQLPPHY